jgi:subtilase family serine protease
VIDSVRPTAFHASSPSGYSPAQIRHAYGYDKITGDGTGQIIAIVDAYGNPNAASDLSTFCAAFGLPAATLNVYYPTVAHHSTYDSGWALETNLDLQWAHVIAPKAKLALVVAPSASLSDLLNAVDYAVNTLGAKQVSMSWGASEFSSEASYDSHFNQTGVSFFAASGDSGAGVIWPAASPYVVAVGGTTLKLDGAGNVLTETAWSDSGGGASAYENKPTYQNNWQSALTRTVPDVSYNADPSTGYPVYITNYHGSTGWITVGGTSAGAPQWAAQQALVNAARSTSLSNADSSIYSTAGAAYSTDFSDITSGSNGGYSAGTGYDFVTGLGSPKVFGLVPALIKL